MPLVTLSERLLAMEARIATLELDLRRVREYAEMTNRMHHEAIVRLSTKLDGSLWPVQR